MQQARPIAGQSVAGLLILRGVTFIPSPLRVHRDASDSPLQASVAALRASRPTLPITQLAVHRAFEVIAHGFQTQRGAARAILRRLRRRDLASQKPLDTTSRTTFVQDALQGTPGSHSLLGIVNSLLLQLLGHLGVHAFLWPPCANRAIVDLQPRSLPLLRFNRDHFLLQFLRPTHGVPKILQLRPTIRRLALESTQQLATLTLDRSDSTLSF
mmetsp:Transcript_13590/g.34175  ORF Transcript_13590/g.34175 Transcript_13590/m.34175 type:complete len:213 (-) Transcript_13590:190-828(-)